MHWVDVREVSTQRCGYQGMSIPYGTWSGEMSVNASVLLVAGLGDFHVPSTANDAATGMVARLRTPSTSNLCEYRIPSSAFAMKANRGSSSTLGLLRDALVLFQTFVADPAERRCERDVCDLATGGAASVDGPVNPNIASTPLSSLPFPWYPSQEECSVKLLQVQQAPMHTIRLLLKAPPRARLTPS